MRLMNQRTGGVVASDLELAITRSARRRGLLHRDALDPASALMLSPCFAVHTAFMRFAIDVVFVGADGVIRRIVPDLRPWRMAVDVGARAVIELAGGAAAAHDVRRGDRVYFFAASDDEVAFLASRSPSLRRIASNPACSGS